MGEEQQAMQPQPQNNMQGMNPMQQFEGMNSFLPNTPLQESGHQMIKELLSDDVYDEKMKRENPWVFGKDNSLTFLDEARKQSKMISFELLKIDTLNETPYYDYTFEMEKKWNVLKVIFETKLDRSLGFKDGGTMNERKAQISQFSENRHISQEESVGQKNGMLSKILGRR